MMDVQIGTDHGATFRLKEIHETTGHLQFVLETDAGDVAGIELPGVDLAFILSQLATFAAWTQKDDE